MNTNKAISLLGTALLIVSGLTAQTNSEYVNVKGQESHQLEFGVMPFIVFNTFTLGYSKATSAKTEHVVRLNMTRAALYGGSFSLMYNYNHSIGKQSRAYLPLWANIKRHNRDFEEINFTGNDGWYPQTKLLKTSIGTGLGTLNDLKNKNMLRIEANLGIMYRTGEIVRGDEPYTLLPTDFVVGTKYGTSYRNRPSMYVYPTMRLKINYVFKLGKH